MRWKAEPRRWKPCFAIVPVKVGDKVIWMERYWSRFYGDCTEVRLWEEPDKAADTSFGLGPITPPLRDAPPRKESK